VVILFAVPQVTGSAMGNERAEAFFRLLMSDRECGCEVFQLRCVELRRVKAERKQATVVSDFLCRVY
jgi:hypothetical protein